MNSKYKRLISDTLLFTMSNFCSKIISFFLIPLYTSILSTTDYGISDMIQTTVNLIYPIFTLSISEATIRYALEKRHKDENVLFVSVGFILFGTIPLILATPFIPKINSQLFQYWGYFILYYFVYNIHYCFIQYARGKKKMRLFALQGIINTIVVIVSNILFLIVLQVGVRGYLLSFILGYVFTSFVVFIFGEYWKELYPFRFSKALVKEMLLYSLPMIPTQIFWWINNAADKWIIIGKLGLAENGVYSAAHKIPTLLTMLTGIFNQAWQVSAFSNYGEKDNSEFFSKVYSTFVFINQFVAVVLITLSEALGRFLFSGDFYRGWSIAPVLLIAAVFNGLSGMLASVFTSAKKTNGLFVSTSIGAVVNIVLNFLLVDMYGSIGAAYATAISCACVFIIRLIHANHYIKIFANYFLQVTSFIVIATQAFCMSKNIGNTWINGFIAVVLVIILNIKHLSFFKNIIDVVIKKTKN